MGCRIEVILLDTCAAIWMATADRSFGKTARLAVSQASTRGELFLSSMTSWEIATLVRRGRFTPRVSAKAFIDQLFLHPGITEIPVDREVTLAAGSLPGELAGDPVDRLIVATAIINGLRVMTRDRNILSYAKRTGAVPAIRC